MTRVLSGCRRTWIADSCPRHDREDRGTSRWLRSRCRGSRETTRAADHTSPTACSTSRSLHPVASATRRHELDLVWSVGSRGLVLARCVRPARKWRSGGRTGGSSSLRRAAPRRRPAHWKRPSSPSVYPLASSSSRVRNRWESFDMWNSVLKVTPQGLTSSGSLAHQHRRGAVELLGDLGVARGAEDRAGAGVRVEQRDLLRREGEDARSGRRAAVRQEEATSKRAVRHAAPPVVSSENLYGCRRPGRVLLGSRSRRG